MINLIFLFGWCLGFVFYLRITQLMSCSLLVRETLPFLEYTESVMNQDLL